METSGLRRERLGHVQYSMRNKRNNATLHRKHWAQFSLQRFLEDGGVCVMELLEGDALAILVHIFRV